MQNPGSETFLFFFAQISLSYDSYPRNFPGGWKFYFYFLLVISYHNSGFVFFFCFFVAGSVGSEIKPWGFVDVIGLIGPVTYHSDTHM